MSTDLSDRDLALISAWLYGPTHIADLAAEHELSLPQLAAWAARPDIAAVLSAMRAFNALRAQDYALACKSAALARLVHIVEHSDDDQSARRAATAILRFDARADRDREKPGRASPPPHIPAPSSPASNPSSATAPSTPPANAPTSERPTAPPVHIHPPAPQPPDPHPSPPGRRSAALTPAPILPPAPTPQVRAPPAPFRPVM